MNVAAGIVRMMFLNAVCLLQSHILCLSCCLCCGHYPWLNDSASGKPESVSAYPPFLSAISLSYQTMGILWPYERHENTACATTELGHLKNSLGKLYASPRLFKYPSRQRRK